ncbi:MAG: GumC family protein [Rhizomicrobium sp.]
MTIQKKISSAPLLPTEQDGDASSRGSGGFDLSGLLRTIIVRQRIIAGTALAVVTLTLIVVFNMTPLYDAKALVMLDQRQNKVVDVDAVLSGLATDPTSIENQLQILRSRKLMSHVVDKLHLDQQVVTIKPPSVLADLAYYVDPENWFGVSAVTQTPEQLKEARRIGIINGLLGAETVTVLGRSSAIEITFRSSDPQKAADTANAIADAYVEDQLNAKFEATQKTSQWLADRLQQLSAQMQSVDAAVQEYKAEHDITQTPTGGSILDQQIAELNGQLVNARSDLAAAQAKYSQVRALQANGRAEDVSQVFQAGMIEQLRTQQEELLRQKAQYLTIFGPRHPKMLDLESQLRDLDSKIDEEVKRVVETVANDVAVASAHVQSLQASLANLEAQSSVQSKAEIKLTELEARSTSAHQLYEAFLGKFKETQGQEGIQTPDSRIISNAIVPGAPAVPNKTRDLELAVAGGLLLGFLLALVAERLDGGVRTVQQIERLIGLPVLSTLPELVGVARAHRQAADRVVEKPLSSFAEAMRGLQMGLALSNIDQRPKVILVTSSVPDEGKTTVALGLARVAAGNDQKVLLVDCDLRRPSIAKALGLAEDANALVDVLSGDAPLKERLLPDPRSTVQCLVASRIRGNPPDLLGSAAMERLLAGLKAEFDMVIIDSAPLLPVNDTKILARLVDAIAFVVRWEKTPREAVTNAVRMLVDIGAPVAGVVMTRADTKRYRYYSYGYQSYYNYNKYYND